MIRVITGIHWSQTSDLTTFHVLCRTCCVHVTLKDCGNQIDGSVVEGRVLGKGKDDRHSGEKQCGQKRY